MTNKLGANPIITENIHTIEAKVNEVFTNFGYSKDVKEKMLRITRMYINSHNDQSKGRLDKRIVSNYINHQEKRSQNGEISRKAFLEYKNMSNYFVQVYETGTITHKRPTLTALPDCFEHVLSDIHANKEWSLKTRKQQHKYTSIFFRWLFSHGHNDLSAVDETTVREYLTDCSSRMVGGSLSFTRDVLKKLFLFLSKDGVLSEEMNKLFLFRVPIEKKIKPFMPQDEIAAVLNVIDQSTAIGKRNYAMTLLAAVTGLRGCDIVGLTLDSIDWRNGEIRITQEKTDRALALPLTSDVGNAIREYIVNARPHTESNKVFLNSIAPFGEMRTTTLTYNLKNYCNRAGITVPRGFHSLRRSVATNMVTSGVSVITVAQTLGHATIDSTKQYISLDSANLKECALDLSGILTGDGRL